MIIPFPLLQLLLPKMPFGSLPFLGGAPGAGLGDSSEPGPTKRGHEQVVSRKRWRNRRGAYHTEGAKTYRIKGLRP